MPENFGAMVFVSTFPFPLSKILPFIFGILKL